MPAQRVLSAVEYQAIQATDPDLEVVLAAWGFPALPADRIAKLRDERGWLVWRPGIAALLYSTAAEFVLAWRPQETDSASIMPVAGEPVNADVHLTWTAEHGWRAAIVAAPNGTVYTGPLAAPDSEVEHFTGPRHDLWVGTDDPEIPTWLRGWVTAVLAGVGIRLA